MKLTIGKSITKTTLTKSKNEQSPYNLCIFAAQTFIRRSKTSSMANSTVQIFKSIFRMAFSYPKSFFKQLNAENWRILKKALTQESPGQIIKNARRLLQNTNADTVEHAQKSVQKFIDTIDFNNSDYKEVVIFASHEASRSGAPLIVLELAKYFKTKHNILPIQLICDGGELLDEFAEVGPTYLMKYYFNAAMLKEEIQFFTKALGEKATINRAYINSEGAGKLIPFLKKANVPKVVALIHEMGHYYDKNAWPHISKYADIIVFPAELVKTKAIQNTKFDEHKLHVIGQGLLKTELLNANKTEHRKAIREELKIEEDAIIILGCGITIFRKGIDTFIFTAISFLNQYKGKKKVYFIWLGEESEHDYIGWSKTDILQSGWEKQIRLIGNRKNTVPYFIGSDVFFMSSRGDPFPCVVHEAMAARLPVIAFEGATGFAELISKDLGITIPYGDVHKAVEALDKAVSQIHQNYYYQDVEKLNNLLDNDRYCEALYQIV